MKHVNQVIHRSITLAFYQRQAGLLLFLLLLLVGIQPSFFHVIQFHHALMRSITSSMSFFLFSSGIWIAYSLRIVLFFNDCRISNAYHFLSSLNALDYSRRWWLFFRSVLIQMVPVLGYALLTMLVAYNDEKYIEGTGIILMAMVLTVITTSAITRLLHQTSLPNIFQTRWWVARSKRGSLPSFLLQFLFRQQFVALVLTKLLSFTALYFFAGTSPQQYEERMLWLIYLTSLIGHSILVYRNHRFMETGLRFYRNMPVKQIHILLSLLLVYTVLLIPELWALKGVIFIQQTPLEYIWLLMTGPLFLLLLHCIQYTEDLQMEELLKLLFGIWIVFVFFSLSTIHWIIPLVCAAFSTLVFFMQYRAFEPRTS